MQEIITIKCIQIKYPITFHAYEHGCSSTETLEMHQCKPERNPEEMPVTWNLQGNQRPMPSLGVNWVPPNIMKQWAADPPASPAHINTIFRILIAPPCWWPLVLPQAGAATQSTLAMVPLTVPPTNAVNTRCNAKKYCYNSAVDSRKPKPSSLEVSDGSRNIVVKPP